MGYLVRSFVSIETSAASKPHYHHNYFHRITVILIENKIPRGTNKNTDKINLKKKYVPFALFRPLFLAIQINFRFTPAMPIYRQRKEGST